MLRAVLEDAGVLFAVALAEVRLDAELQLQEVGELEGGARSSRWAARLSCGECSRPTERCRRSRLKLLGDRLLDFSQETGDVHHFQSRRLTLSGADKSCDRLPGLKVISHGD